MVIQVKRRCKICWIFFVVCSLTTVLVDHTMWFSDWYWYLLSVLGVMSLVFSICVLTSCGVSVLSVLGVLVGLGIGQSWFFGFAATIVLWKLYGFAS